MHDLAVLQRRLNRIGIEIELASNVPWVYLTKVNGNAVRESDFTANHGFTIAWLDSATDKIILDHNTKRIFEIIRKYRFMTTKITEQHLIDFCFEKQIISSADNGTAEDTHYYTLDFGHDQYGLCLITNCEDEAKDEGWYVEFFEAQGMKRIEDYDQLMRLIDILGELG